MSKTLRQAAAEYDPSGWWVGWAGPFPSETDALVFADTCGGGVVYEVGPEGLPV